jgi:TP901 family phage tail tape measure protein
MADSVEYNLYTRFHFKPQPGLANMKATGSAFQHLTKSAKRAQAGMAQVGKGFQQIAMFGGAAGIAIGGLIKRGIAFDKAWYDVKAVATGAASEIEKLGGKAQRLGATTLFTAEEAAQGMEQLIRSGLNVKQVYSAVGPVLSLAIGDNIELAAAAKTSAMALNTFKMNASDTTKVVDAFAYVSRNTMTNTTELSEAFKFAVPAARMAKQSFHDLMGTLGLLAQAGYRGSLAGTAYKNSLMKLAKGSEAAYKVFGGRTGFLKAVTEKGKWKPFQEILDLTLKKLAGFKNEATRAGLAFKIFGIRGIATLAAYEDADPEKMTAMLKNFEQGAKGSAKYMAEMKRQSIHGQWLLLRSAIDGVAIALFTALRPAIIKVAKPLTENMAAFAGAIKSVNAGMSETAVVEKYGTTIAHIIFGIKEAAVELWATAKGMSKTLFTIFKQVSGESNLTGKRVVKLVAKFTMLSIALTPVIAGVGMLSLAFSGMFNVVTGGLKVVNALTSRWGIVFLGLTLLFAGGQKDGESFFATMTRGLKGMLSLVNKLLWPFKKLSEYIGTLPALMAAIGAYRMGKFGLGKMITGAKAKFMGATGLGKKGGALGEHGAQGTPVFITNWPLGMRFGGGGGGAGLGGIAQKMGFLGRFKHLGAALGTGIPGLLTGGKLVTGGTAATMGSTAKLAATGAAAGTATTALVAFGAALAPAVAGLREMGVAYTAEGKAKKLAQLREKQKGAEDVQFLMEIFRGKRTMEGKLRGFRSLSDARGETWEQKRKRDFLRRFGPRGVEQIGGAKEALAKGQAWKAKELLAGFGIDKFIQAIPKMTANDMKTLDLNHRHLKVLERIATASTGTIDAIEKGWQTTIQIDGKTVAVVNAQVVQDSRERAGKTPKQGARRRALERGVP